MNVDDIRKRVGEIKALCEAATPGPWKWTQFTDELGARIFVIPESGKLEVYPLVIAEVEHGFPTSDFIVNSRTDLPWAIETIEALLAERKEGYMPVSRSTKKMSNNYDAINWSANKSGKKKEENREESDSVKEANEDLRWKRRLRTGKMSRPVGE